MEQLDQYIVGQNAAKRAVAVAIRNRWRRQQLPEEMRNEVAPKNILMIGPTGVGKTEIARRLAKLTGAPFIKVEATKYTEVGYYGRDVESMVRELVENCYRLGPRTRTKKRRGSGQAPRRRAAARSGSPPVTVDVECPQRRLAEQYERTSREDPRNAAGRRTGSNDTVEMTIEQKATPVVMGGMGMEHMDVDFERHVRKNHPQAHRSRRELTVSRSAATCCSNSECDALLDPEKINAAAIELAENLGIIFIDEIDKVVASDCERGRCFSTGRAARSAADRRRHVGPNALRIREDGSHPVRRRRSLSSLPSPAI